MGISGGRVGWNAVCVSGEYPASTREIREKVFSLNVYMGKIHR